MKNKLSQEEIKEIHELCKEYKIKNYTINSDGTIDVDGDVGLSGNGLSIIPIRFNKVSGNFECYDNKLTSLEHCPKEVGGDFLCSINKLTSLEHCPKEVGGGFYCSYNEIKFETLIQNIIDHGIYPNEISCDYNSVKIKVELRKYKLNTLINDIPRNY